MDRLPSAAQPNAASRGGAACARCGASVPPADISSGDAGVARGALLCHACFAHVTRQPDRASPEPPRTAAAAPAPAEAPSSPPRVEARMGAQQFGGVSASAPTTVAAKTAPAAEPQDLAAAVKEILFELRRVARRQEVSAEAHDLRWMAAVLGQIAALFLAVVMPLLRGNLAEAPMWLLAAVFAQLFALTMFYLSRSKQ